ncbi:unnamed protein product [Closterium sp. NIES-65]|nr:unnamed protein product [Closterium sp. NIES-65]
MFDRELSGEPGAYLRSITTLILRNNSLSGAIWPALAEMTALRKLNLGGNRLSSAVLAALLESESLKALDEVQRRTGGDGPGLAAHGRRRAGAAARGRDGLCTGSDGPGQRRTGVDEPGQRRTGFDNNALTGPFCNALLPARELWLGFNDLGGATAGSSANATGGGDGGGGGEEEEGGGSLYGCMLPTKLKILSAPYAGLRGSVPPDLFLATNARSGRKPSVGGLGRIIWIDLSYNNLSGSLKALTVLPTGVLDLSHNNFSGGIPEAFFSGGFSLADLRFNELSGPLFDTRREDWSYDWDRLRVSDNSARMAGTVGACYIPVPAPGVQVSATETEALLEVHDALLGKAAGGTEFADGGSSLWGEILRSWDASSSSACGWYGVGCTSDGHVDTLHLLGNAHVTLHPNFVPESPDCEHTQCGDKIFADADRRPPPQVQFFLEGLPGGSSNSRSSADGSLSEAVGQLTHLTSLRISEHALSGGLPLSLSRLSHLVALDFSSTATSPAPSPPPSSPSPRCESSPSARTTSQERSSEGLMLLALDQNRLDGSLPRELGALWTLTNLHLHGNALLGGILYTRYRPYCLQCTCPVGPPRGVPAADPSGRQQQRGLGQSFSLEFLSHLDLSSNKLTGSISNALVTGLKALSHLDLSENLLSGSLPHSLAAIAPLTHLDLSRNKLKGSLPAFCQGKQSLASLLLSSNTFSGTIPALMRAVVPSLQVHLASNALSGSVPPSLSDLPTSCFRPGNPKLCGKPLPASKKRSSKPMKGRL